MSFESTKAKFEGKAKCSADPPMPRFKQTRIPEHRSIENASVMCDSKLFTNPMHLVSIDKDGKFCCHTDTIAELSKIEHPLNVVAVTGRYRHGKSYLLNRLAEQQKGFVVGHTTNAETKGIWIWCRPHPTQEGQVLVLMDTEGIGDTYKINQQEDTWLFTLATLLSSTLVYNTKGVFDAEAIERLRFLQHIESSIKINGDKTDEALLDFFFPVFVVAMRDFSTEPVTRTGKPATPDQYLEECLMVEREKKGKYIETFNRNRLLIRKYFKKRKCFLFEQPCSSKKLKVLDSLSDEGLSEDFLDTMKQFKRYIYTADGPTPYRRDVTSMDEVMFGNLTMHYVNSIRDNETPSILEAAKAMADTENQYAVKAASDIYKKEMQRRIAEINPKDSALVAFHKDCMEIAVNFFKTAIVFDDKDVFQDQAMENFKNLFATFKRVCDKNSESKCEDVLQRLDLKISRKMDMGTYRHPSGYDEYITDVNWIVKTYEGMTGLGTRSRLVLQKFIDDKEEQEKTVYQMVREKQESQDGKAPSEVKHTPGNLRYSITKSNSVRDKLVAEDNEMEERIKDEMFKAQENGKEEIRKKCDENLQLKIIESERQINEQSEDTETIDVLKAQIAHLKKLLEHNKMAASEERNLFDDGSVYNVPWDRFEIEPKRGPTLKQLDEQKPAPSQTSHGKTPGEKKKWCPIQ